MNRRFAVVALALTAAVPIAALGRVSWQRAQVRHSMAGAAGLTGKQMPRFELCTAASAACSPVESFTAGRPAVIVFTRPGCPFCETQLRELRDLGFEDVELLQVVVAERDIALDLARRYTPLTTLWDGRGAFRAVFQGTGVPFTIVVDGRGIVQHASVGQQSRDLLRKAVEAARRIV